VIGINRNWNYLLRNKPIKLQQILFKTYSMKKFPNYDLESSYSIGEILILLEYRFFESIENRKKVTNNKNR